MRACLTVDLKALKHNVKILSKKNQTGFFCPIVKANAYGHGALQITKALCQAGVKQVGVVSIEEALELNQTARKPVSFEKGATWEAFSSCPKNSNRGFSNKISVTPLMDIYILGPFYKDQIPWLSLYGFIPIVGGWNNLKALAHFAKTAKKPISFHLKFNTGMNRFGFLPSEKEQVLRYIQKHPALKLKGLASHLSQGEGAGSQTKGSAVKQIHSFKKVCGFFKTSLPKTNIDTHLLNSEGWFALWCHGLNHSNKDCDLGFRPGIALYGVKPPVDFLSHKAKKKYHSLDLRPIACLKAFVVHSYTVSRKQKVSYGGEWQAKQKSTLAVVSMGYADGLPYRLYKEGEVLFRGKKAPIAGRICMDFFMIDVSHQAREGEIKKGEEVVIFGSQKKNFISVKDQAKKAGSIPEEFLTRLGPRVVKIYK